MKRKVFIYVTGGLGNQLYQLAAGMHKFPNDEKILISQNIENADTHGRLFALSGFNLPREVSINYSYKSFWLTTKLLNLILRTEHSGNLTQVIAMLFGRALLRINPSSEFIRTTKLISAAQFAEKPRIRKNENSYHLVVGYFQELDFWKCEKLISDLKQLSLKNPPAELNDFRELAKSAQPLIVHIRKGDYQTSNLFEPLPAKYYETAVNLAWSTKRFREIWIFSDDPPGTLNLIPRDLRKFARVITEFQDSNLVTFEIMRLGEGYVIANSTFSWWAAQLSYKDSPLVYFPGTWFKGKSTSTARVPKKWIRIPF